MLAGVFFEPRITPAEYGMFLKFYGEYL